MRLSSATARRVAALGIGVGLVLGVPSVAAAAPNPPGANQGPPAGGNQGPPPSGGQRPPAAHRPSTPATAVAPVPGVRVTKTHWYTDRRVGIWIYSPAMGESIQVQILLARDWATRPDQSFPQLTMLDGMRPQGDQSGWAVFTKVEDFFRDKNVNVVLPVGGDSSFYTNWQRPDHGIKYKWETFLTKEMPPVIEGSWRSTSERAIEGLSMGGTGAMTLAARNPGLYRFAGSFSGILQMSTPGMPQAIKYALTDGGFNSDNMYGPADNPAWAAHDPYVLAEKLRGTSLYIASGNGVSTKTDPPTGFPGLSSNYKGVGLEVLARETASHFSARLKSLGIPATTVNRTTGLHYWTYWEKDLVAAWPQAAQAIGVLPDRPQCRVDAAFAKVAASNRMIGRCISTVYDVPGGRAQDFTGGVIVSSAKTSPRFIVPQVAGALKNSGGTGGKLGFPISDVRGARNAKEHSIRFQGGTVYWESANRQAEGARGGTTGAVRVVYRR